jgi:predicted transposase YbfD/YdcC
LLDSLNIQDKDITADAMLTQRELAEYLVAERNAHYHFIVKGNQPTLLQDIKLHFSHREEPDFVAQGSSEHGRIETRRIWTTIELNEYLDFPYVGQSFAIERESYNKRTGEYSQEIAYGITSRCSEQAGAQRLLTLNQGHWSIENGCHYILDWNFDEDRSRIRTGHGPENMTRFRRFAIGLLKSRGVRSVAQKMRELNRNTRMVLDYLRMTKNTSARGHK